MKGKKSKKKVIIAIAVVIIAAALIVSYITRPKEDSFAEETAKTRDITTYYSFSGNIESEEKQEIFSKNGLSISKLCVKEGDRVKAGDLLFELDNETISSNLEQAKANVNIARINYEKARGTGKNQQMEQVSSALSSAQLAFDNAADNLDKMKGIFDAGGISEAELDQAQTGYDNARIALESAQKNYSFAEEAAGQNIRIAEEQLNQTKASYSLLEEQLEDTRVYAEVNGEVAEIYAEENDSLNMGAKIMDLVNYDALEVTIKVDEYELSTVTEGKEVSVGVNALNKEISGKVSDISREALVVNDVSYFPTSIALDKDADLRVGMSVEVRILNQNAKNAVTITMKALQFDNENKPYVYYRDQEGKVRTRQVSVGVNDGSIVQILDGVKTGETILVPAQPDYIEMMMDMRKNNMNPNDDTGTNGDE